MAKTGAQIARDIKGVLARPRPAGPARSARQLDAEIAAALRGISRDPVVYDSRNTSRNQVPALFKQVAWIPGTVNLDVGGGRYDRGTAYLADQDVTSIVFDPFNRSEAHNLAALRQLAKTRADTATITNVLNVIKEGRVPRGRCCSSPPSSRAQEGSSTSTSTRAIAAVAGIPRGTATRPTCGARRTCPRWHACSRSWIDRAA